MTLDFTALRTKMVDGQLRTTDVTDLAILDAFLAVPREDFVPAKLRPLAYIDEDIEIFPGFDGDARYLMEPSPFARLVQAAEITPSDLVLDVGCATGYAASVLAHLCANVVALEQDAGLAASARTTLAPQSTISVVSGPLSDGWAKAGPYDVIVVEGSIEVAPHALCRQLKDGGRLVCVLGSGPAAKAMLYRRSGDDVGGRPVFDAAAALLPGFAKAAGFAF